MVILLCCKRRHAQKKPGKKAHMNKTKLADKLTLSSRTASQTSSQQQQHRGGGGGGSDQHQYMPMQQTFCSQYMPQAAAAAQHQQTALVNMTQSPHQLQQQQHQQQQMAGYSFINASEPIYSDPVASYNNSTHLPPLSRNQHVNQALYLNSYGGGGGGGGSAYNSLATASDVSSGGCPASLSPAPSHVHSASTSSRSYYHGHVT